MLPQIAEYDGWECWNYSPEAGEFLLHGETRTSGKEVALRFSNVALIRTTWFLPRLSLHVSTADHSTGTRLMVTSSDGRLCVSCDNLQLEETLISGQQLPSECPRPDPRCDYGADCKDLFALAWITDELRVLEESQVELWRVFAGHSHLCLRVLPPDGTERFLHFVGTTYFNLVPRAVNPTVRIASAEESVLIRERLVLRPDSGEHARILLLTSARHTGVIASSIVGISPAWTL